MILTDLFESHHACPECGGPAFSDLILAEKKDACYYKVKASAKVWPSAYASGRLVQCRKKGASNYGNKSEGVAEGWKDIVAGGAMALGAMGAGAQTIPNVNAQQVELANKYYNVLVQRAKDDGRELDTRTLNLLKAKAADAAAQKFQQNTPQQQNTFPSQGSERKVSKDIGQFESQGVAEDTGQNYAEQLAQQVFNHNPNIKDENQVMNLGYSMAKSDLGRRAQGIFRSEDFPSDFVSAYFYLQRQGIAEDQLAEKSVSQAQFRTMAAAAHNPKFAKKVGISPAVAKEFHSADKHSNYKKLPDRATEGEQQKGADYRDPKEVNYDDDYHAMVSRVKKLAGVGPMKTVYDPQKRVYRNMPTAVQPKR